MTDLIFTISDSVIVNFIYYSWVHNLDLKDVAIMENGMLSDRHMYAVNKLMASQFTHTDGFHSTLFALKHRVPTYFYWRLHAGW